MELKPCPFCGSSDIYAEIADYVQEDFVRCNTCKAQTGTFYDEKAEVSEAKAIESWNRRSAAASEWRPMSEFKEEMLSRPMLFRKKCMNGYAYHVGSLRRRNSDIPIIGNTLYFLDSMNYAHTPTEFAEIN